MLSLLWAVPMALIAGGLALGTRAGRVAFVAGWAVLGPIAAAVWATGSRISTRTFGGRTEIVAALRSQLVNGSVFVIVDTLIGALIIANVRFYFTSTLGILGRPVPWLGEGIRVGHLAGWIWLSPLTLWALVQLYALPLLVRQQIGVGVALRRAAILVLDNMLFTLGLAVLVIVVAGILVLTGAGAFVLLGGILAILTGNAAQVLLNKYEPLPGEQREEA